jgi:hypothetical protein
VTARQVAVNQLGRCVVAKMLIYDKAQRIAANIAKLPDLLGR